MGDIQIRAVPPQLIAAAKERAEAEDLSLSAYIRDLIQKDVDQHTEDRRKGTVLRRIAARGPLGTGEITPGLTRGILEEARGEKTARTVEDLRDRS